MAQQIQDLVASIRKDGIDAARKEADEIISDAKETARTIVADARKEAERIMNDNQKEMAVRDQSARASLEQAGRDVVLSLQKKLSDILNTILASRVEKAFSSEELVKVISAALENSDVTDGAVEINDELYRKLAKTLEKDLADEMKKGLEIRPVKDAPVGFRIVEKDGSGYYDFSPEETAELIKPFLSPAVSEIVFR